VQEYSVPPLVTIGDSANLTDLVWDGAAEAPDTVQFSRRTAGGWEEVTCAGFRAEVTALAQGLVATGIEPGDRVALMSRTRYEWTLVDFAVWAAGAVTVPIYETSSAEQVEWILADSGAVACVVETAAHGATVAGVRDRVPGLRHVWQLEDGALEGLVDPGTPPAPTTSPPSSTPRAPPAAPRAAC